MGKDDEKTGHDEVTQLENTTSAVAEPTLSPADEKLTLRDVWAHRRVLGFCECLKPAQPLLSGTNRQT